MTAGHIDALTAKLKPVSKKPNTAGYVQLGVAPYAGALNSTWWDRDLGVGGRVIVKTSDGKIESKLVKLDWPIARISTLAPHFGSAANGPFNQETQMTPVVGLERWVDQPVLCRMGVANRIQLRGRSEISSSRNIFSQSTSSPRQSYFIRAGYCRL
jgi:aspartyl aminopeptidase